MKLTNTPTTSVEFNLAFSDYQKAQGLNQSSLKLFDTDRDGCPARFKWAQENPDLAWKDSEAFRFGRALHSYILEPERYPTDYAVVTDSIREMVFAAALEQAPEKSRAEYVRYNSWTDFRDAKGDGPASATLTKLAAWKEWKESIESVGAEVLSNADHRTIRAMSASLNADPEIRAHLNDPSRQTELSVFAPLEILKTGDKIQAKCRIDQFNSDSGDVLDLKTCQSANPREFARSVSRFGYDLQAAFYKRVAEAAGLKVERFGFVAIEKTAPYLCALHWLPEDWLECAEMALDRLLSELRPCILEDCWPGYGSGMLEPEPWKMNEIEALTS